MGLDEEQQKVLTDLKRRRGVIKAALTRIQTFISRFDPLEQAVSLIGFRQEELPQINKRFDDVQSQIELITVDDIEGAEAERDRFETDYYAVRSQIQEIMDHEKTINTTAHNTSHGNSINLNRTQLAPIPLPKFSGDIQDWASFYDIFQAMVHNEDGYSAAQKFYYLRSCLEGAALDLVRSTPICDGNYEIVVQMLKQRYDNRSLVIQSHIKSILDCPFMGVSSSVTLQKLYANVTTHIAALKALDQPVEHWDAWLVTIITSRLDKDTAHGWLLRQKNTNLPKYSELEAFLASRCVALEGSEVLSKSNGSATSSGFKKNAITEKRSFLVASEFEPCPFCSGGHRLFGCEGFKKLSVGDRLTFARKSTLCFNCLSTKHLSNTCRSTFTCRECKLKHNTLLHLDNTKKLAKDKETSKNVVDDLTLTAGGSGSAALLVGAGHGHVFLATATVYVQDKYGVQHECRLVLDSGSQLNFISKSLASRLSLPLKKASIPVSGIGANQIHAASFGELTVHSRTNDYKMDLVCYVLPNIVSDLSASPVPEEGWNIPDELSYQLADPCFYKRRTVDLLVGGGAFFDILGMERRALKASTVWLQESRFGWIVTGELGSTCLAGINLVQDLMEENGNISLLEEDARYGRLSKSNLRSLEEQEALKHFENTAKRDGTGRFILRLPFKANTSELGDTLAMARCRFLSVERKLQLDDELKKAYSNFMEEYLAMGHMERISEIESSTQICYLPHHPVVKTSSLTTKIRVVFDASAKGCNGKSLNDLLMRGPVVQGDIFTILCRFRKHFFVISADVEKMYRQVAIAREDCDMQRILWRSDPSEQLKSYRLLTVTYGTTPASFMATQCLAVLAEENKLNFPEASKAIHEDFYMDDLMTGCESEEECLLLQQQILSIMKSAGLLLRKWCSNSSTIRNYLSKLSEDPLFPLEIQGDDAVKSLGLYWKPVEDEFRFDGVMKVNKIKTTKRVILSDLNKVFDPLGFLAPVLIKGKIFIQQIWQLKINWDSFLPEDIQNRWDSYYAALEDLRLVSIPRCTSVTAGSLIEIHGFCDASQEAYGACVYIRSKSQNNKWQSRLLCARSRVASLKGETIPRLELNGALVLVQLINKVASAWEVDSRSCYLWTDSTIVLGWLNAQVIRLKVYVANRVNQILEVTDAKQWRYVKTEENPADIISRGISAKGLSKSELWWNGPNWLSNDDNARYQESYAPINEYELPEQRPLQLSLVGLENINVIFQHYSEWNRLRKGVAWLSRFVDFLRSKNSVSKTSYITLAELQKAEHWILSRVQLESFPEEIAAYKTNKDLPPRSKLKGLAPFLQNGLILVGGRLSNSDLTEKQKYPIVLPHQHKITKLIFSHFHNKLLHCGPQLLLSAVRQTYWPLKGRLLARSTVLRCIPCVRANPKFQIPLMGPLPQQRVQCSRPFTVTGVDFAGPVTIRSGIRARTNKKAWISLFICFSTKAVHLEVVEDLTSQAFIATLRRFISRRGKPKELWSDNGTNFVGARKELTTYLKNIRSCSVEEGISWHFNPPSAPHFGGLWESAVKSTKYHLTRVLKDALLTSSELQTLLCQIEACLNSRPLTPMSSDPNDLQALTPAHFLVGGPMTMHPEPDLANEEQNCLRRWRYVQRLMQSFWQRWQTEYLPQLQIRGKWTTNNKALSVNDIVIVKDENMPPTKWKLARITATHPGNDGKIRVVTIRTANNTEMRRPVVKLCRLPVDEREEC